ncbi:hypothetical protein [Luteibaculum oceani]|uniref:DUF937 domain-containing protein n=1 Tax=Luteibaculum oceani TaxID=1294296 RepID=A0A5C6VJX4_9FLAO|nr:hypothetical protein [Luteibaculum oceani]TXC85219.1 hypothetical protein FRX97_00940 [Luteibaculum oceani]
MIQDLIKQALKEKGGDLLGGFDLNGQQQEKALDLAKESVMDGITSEVKSGNFGILKNAFSQGSQSGLVQGIIGNYGNSLINKLGLSPSISKAISEQLIPMVFKFINNKEDAPTNSESGIKDLVGGAIGNKIGGMLKGKFGF